VPETTQGRDDLGGTRDGHVPLFAGSAKQYGNLHIDNLLRSANIFSEARRMRNAK
jgi:hypothetical protein